MKGMKNMIIIVILSVIILLLIVIGAIFISGGILLKAEYLEPWEKSYSQKFSDIRIQLVSHGLLAASGHNMQPWKIKLDEKDKNVFYLYVDSNRLTKEVDPFARQTMITQGTFLEYVKVSGEKLGYETNLEFFPYGEYDESNLEESMNNKPVAKIILNETEYKNSEFFDYMFIPDTNREAYQKYKLTIEQINHLHSINSEQNIVIKMFQDEDSLKRLGNYVIEGAKIESSIHRINEESAKVFRANEGQKNKYRYGYSLEGQGIDGTKKYILQGLITLFPSFNSEKSSSDMYVESTKLAVENTSCYGMIITEDNSRLKQVKAGMLYSRLILTAHSLGLVMQPPSQVLEEYKEMEEQYNNIHDQYTSEGETIQMLFRIGKPTKEVPQSMRRDVMELIIKD